MRPILLFLTGMLIAVPSVVQAQNETRLLAVARESAIIAGGAKYCKMDPELVEEFIARAEARLTVLAADEYEKVLARVEFKNILDTYTVRAPEKSCAEFSLTFERARQSLQ